jgi:hypothetical protein
LELGLEEPTQFAGHTHRWILLGLSIDGDDEYLGEDDDVVQLAHEQGAHRKAQASNMVARKTMEINSKPSVMAELEKDLIWLLFEAIGWAQASTATSPHRSRATSVA